MSFLKKCQHCGNMVRKFDEKDFRVRIAKATWYHLQKDIMTEKWVCICGEPIELEE